MAKDVPIPADGPSGEDHPIILAPSVYYHECLSRNQRERRRLRTLLRVALEIEEEQARTGPTRPRVLPSLRTEDSA